MTAASFITTAKAKSIDLNHNHNHDHDCSIAEGVDEADRARADGAAHESHLGGCAEWWAEVYGTTSKLLALARQCDAREAGARARLLVSAWFERAVGASSAAEVAWQWYAPKAGARACLLVSGPRALG